MPTNKPGYHKAWYAANKDRMTEYRRKNRARRKNTALLHYFGITLDQYEEMKAAQMNVCAICLNPPGKLALAVDHDHMTNQVRGLLCARCNVAMERIDMIDDWAMKATEYKQRSMKPKEQS
jgi:hypothetical protein